MSASDSLALSSWHKTIIPCHLGQATLLPCLAFLTYGVDVAGVPMSKSHGEGSWVTYRVYVSALILTTSYHLPALSLQQRKCVSSYTVVKMIINKASEYNSYGREKPKSEKLGLKPDSPTSQGGGNLRQVNSSDQALVSISTKWTQ